MALTERATESQSAYVQVRQAILDGKLLPGQRLVEKELSEQFGLGRAAIRTALARLEQEGLVESEPFRGARVRSLSEAEAVEVLEARAALEALSAYHAARRATPEQIETLWAIHRQMEQRHRAGDLWGMSELNNLLHRTLVEISEHRTAARLIEGLRAQGVRHQFRTILVPGRPQQSLREHRRIIAAVAAHQPQEAAQAMKAHLEGVIAALRGIVRSSP
ncbi:GntR family transcriptional regulator [Allomeiothermus silvanus]|uniref:GntR family transcriptional regulator n=1 Tax=Allomeiothermus silvanus TaxID=52022 RepID=UPI0023F29780|nr:GntR family transcriptional regulator [Allomeiothermus silvanus]